MGTEIDKSKLVNILLVVVIIAFLVAFLILAWGPIVKVFKNIGNDELNDAEAQNKAKIIFGYLKSDLNNCVSYKDDSCYCAQFPMFPSSDTIRFKGGTLAFELEDKKQNVLDTAAFGGQLATCALSPETNGYKLILIDGTAIASFEEPGKIKLKLDNAIVYSGKGTKTLDFTNNFYLYKEGNNLCFLTDDGLHALLSKKEALKYACLKNKMQ